MNTISVYRPLSCIIALLLLLHISACGKKDSGNTTTTHPTNNTKDTTIKTYLALGDSYTIGQSIDSAGRYPAQAAADLKAEGVNIPGIRYIATTGWTTLDLQSAISAAHLTDTFDFVSLLIGVNDQFQGFDTGGYRVHFRQLLQMSLAFAGNKKTHVAVVSIPDYGVTPFGGNDAMISAQIDEFNAINKQVTDSAGIAYVNVTGYSRAFGSDATYLAGDGLHYSAKEYGIWATALAAVMYNALH